MNHYIEIKIKKQKKIVPPVVINELVSNFHFHIASLDMNSIGLSFPEHGENLGTVVRIHGSESDLKKLGMQWIGRVCSMVETSDLLLVPDNATYRTYSRVREQYSMSKLRNFAKKHNLSKEKIKEEKMKVYSSFTNLPFLSLSSNSNGNHYKRFVACKDMSAKVDGTFDSFGFSKSSTVPHF